MSAIWTSFVGFLELILRTLIDWTGNLGIAIILFTILIRAFLLPLTLKQLKSSKKMQELQPMMAELRRKYGRDQQKLTEEMTKLYRENGANPAGGCLPLVIQLPIFLGVYRAVINLVQHGNFSQSVTTFLGIELGKIAWQNGALTGWQYLILPILSIVLQLLVSLMAQPKIQDPQQKAMTQAFLLMPLLFGYIGFTFNQGAVLYWVAGSFLSVVQQFFVTGFGSLTNYLPFLPNWNGFIGHAAPVPQTEAGEQAADAPEPAKSDFWSPLNKLTASTAGANDAATEDAIRDAKQQINRKRR